MFLIAGGYDGRWQLLSSAEMLARTSSGWVSVNNLPRKFGGVRGVTLGGVLYMTG